MTGHGSHRRLRSPDVGLTSGKFETFLYHLAALVIVAVFAFVGSWMLYKITDLVIPLRVSSEQEIAWAGLEPAWGVGAGFRSAWWSAFERHQQWSGCLAGAGGGGRLLRRWAVSEMHPVALVW